MARGSGPSLNPESFAERRRGTRSVYTSVNDTHVSTTQKRTCVLYSTLVNSIRLFLGLPDASVSAASPALFTDPVLFPLVLATRVAGDPGALARGVGGA